MFVIIITSTKLPVNAQTNDTYLSENIQVYCRLIGSEYNICPELIMAIIEAESSGDAYAVNYDGSCIGLMQVSERWHYDRMQRLNVDNLFDEYGNILVGTDYLYELIKQHDDIAVALMYYNGDADAENFANGDCEISYYAESILERSAELEKLHENENINNLYEQSPNRIKIRQLKYALC